MMQSLISAPHQAPQECIAAESECSAAGAIVDSWVEPPKSADADAVLVLQVAPRGRPRDLIFVEAEASLVSDRLWLEDLSENLCHGSMVLASGSWSRRGFLAATRLQLTR